MLTVGSLFSGIGGFDLGLERAGMRVVWQCEQDEFCRRVLTRHWPGVACYPDVRALVADADGSDGWRRSAGGRVQEAVGAGSSQGSAGTLVPVQVPSVDVLCGGFPCQDLSYAGRGAGIEGERSGLWSEYARLIRELRPRYVVVENVPALLTRGLGRVLADLAACGYDAEWDCLPASAFGAPHRRDRIWLVAYLNGSGEHGFPVDAEVARASESVGYPNSAGSQGHGRHDERADERLVGASGWWEFEPDVGRVAHGVPARVDRLRSLGNALVPQIAEWIGRRILEYESSMKA